MKVEVNNGKTDAIFRNGKYEYTFTPKANDEKIKLYHMGCKGVTRISKIQIEKGDEVTSFEIPYEKPSEPSGIFKNLRDLDIEMRDPNSSFWSRIKANNIGMLTEFKNNDLKTILTNSAEGIATQVRKQVSNDVVNSSEFNVKLNEIKSSLISLQDGYVKRSEINITDDGITLASGKQINGKTLTSMITTSPENITAITNKMVITPSYDNLVFPNFRKRFVVKNSKFKLTPEITDDIVKDKDSFKISLDLEWGSLADHDKEAITFCCEFEDGTKHEKNYYLFTRGNLSDGILDTEIKVDFTFEESRKRIKSYYFMYTPSREGEDFYNKVHLNELKIYKMRNAEFIVDGTIKGRQIEASSINTWHIKAGSISSFHIESESIKGDHLKVDEAFANKLASNDAFIAKLTVRDIFARNVQAIKIKAGQIEADVLKLYKGYIGGFQIGKHEKGVGWWLTGTNQFYVGMSNGNGSWGQTALWVNWGTRWDEVGPNAWYVKESGEMYCKNRAYFWKTPTVIGDLKVTGNIFYDDGKNNSGKWIYSPEYVRIANTRGYLYFYRQYGSYDWVDANKEISDRRYKTNIQDSTVNALDVLGKLKTYSFTKTIDGKSKDISCGIMAQDVEEHLPDGYKELPEEIKSYSPFEMIPYLVKGIQELTEQNKQLQKEVENIKNGK